jgi:hypothetical protein
MRTLFAFLLGVGVTLGGAYYHDTYMLPPPGVAAKPIVNWDVAREISSDVIYAAYTHLNKLLSK